MDIANTLPEPRARDTGLRHPDGCAVAAALPRASLHDSLRVLLDVLLPTIAKGVIIRRPAVLALAERLDLDRRAIRRMQWLRHRYGPQPLVLRMPDRPRALILDPDDVHRVLQQTPEPFSTASSEKRAALAHLEPKGSLISRGPPRTARRQLNEQALQSERAQHSQAGFFAEVVQQEAQDLLALARHRGGLTWDDFAPAWFRIVRQVVLGRAARDDHGVTELMARLRHHANWAFLWPRRTDLIEQLLQRLRHYLDEADPHSLVGSMAALHPSPRSAPEHQVPQWLFAADPAGMAAFRALALLATHPAQAEGAREEACGGAALHKPMLRATVLESLRLWPTTPLVLRETTAETHWQGGTLAAGSGIVIFAPYFHRDTEHLPYADRFCPQLWLAERTTREWPLIPFSSGPATCPGRHVVLLLTSTLLSELLQGARWQLERPGWLGAGRPLPATLSHAGLRFSLRPPA